LAGYFARWSGEKELGTKSQPNPKFGKKTDDYPVEYAYANESLAPWIFMISKGGLTVPTNQFLLDVDKMDQAFNNFHGGVASFDRGSRIIDRFTEELVVLFAGKKLIELNIQYMYNRGYHTFASKIY
jgi:hypothetical protein